MSTSFVPLNGVYSNDYRTNWLKFIGLNTKNFYRYSDCSFCNYDKQYQEICNGYSGSTLSIHTREAAGIYDNNEDIYNNPYYFHEYLEENGLYRTFIFKIPKFMNSIYKKELLKYQNDMNDAKITNVLYCLEYDMMIKFFENQKSGWKSKKSFKCV